MQMFVGARRAAGPSASHAAADQLGCSPPSPPHPGFTKDGANKRKNPVRGSSVEAKSLVNVRSQRSKWVVK